MSKKTIKKSYNRILEISEDAKQITITNELVEKTVQQKRLVYDKIGIPVGTAYQRFVALTSFFDDVGLRTVAVSADWHQERATRLSCGCVSKNQR